jgi:hypothetical protein
VSSSRVFTFLAYKIYFGQYALILFCAVHFNVTIVGLVMLTLKFEIIFHIKPLESSVPEVFLLLNGDKNSMCTIMCHWGLYK